MPSKKARQSVADYSRPDYEGSLLQHMMLELGSIENQDRLSLLEKTINSEKGIVSRDNDIDIKAASDAKSPDERLETVYRATRVESYLLKETKGFCDTVDGIFTILLKFDADMKKAVDEGKDRIATDMAKLNLDPSPEKPAKAPKTPKKSIPGTSGRPMKNIAKKPDPNSASEAQINEAAGPATPIKEIETPIKQQKKQPDRGQWGNQVKPLKAPSSKHSGPWTMAPREAKLALSWQKFLTGHLPRVAKRITDYAAKVAKEQILKEEFKKLSAAEKDKWTAISNFRPTFPDHLKSQCKVFTTKISVASTQGKADRKAGGKARSGNAS